MSTRVPAIPAPTASNLLQVSQAVKNVLDVREGLIGDPLDANVTFRDLVDAGIAATKPGVTGSVATIPILPAWSSPDGYDGSQDMSTPTAPANFSATSGMTSIVLQWDAPAYRNHSYAEVWRSPTNVIGNAVLIGTSDSRFYTDAVGRTSQTYFYWVRFVSQANVFGPYNAVSGTSSSTSLVGTTDLSDLIITSQKLADSAVTNGKIASSAVTTAKLADLAVEAAKLADSSVTATKIANLAVGTAAIQDAAIVSAKIANLAVGNAAIANAAITNAKIADLAVDNAKIASLDAAKITTGFLSADRIQAGTLDAKIANIDAAVITSGTITQARIGDGTITSAKIANTIQSTNYIAGSAGWAINKSGSVEFQDATVRGVVRSNDGLFVIDTINKFISISV